MEALINRVHKTTDLCWDSFSAKVGCGLISINKEASMQLQFAYLLKNTLDLVVYNDDESVELELETGIPLNGRMRECDIVVEIVKGDKKCFLPIEMKCYKEYASSGGKRGASDIFMKDVYEDLQLLEHYSFTENYIDGIVLVMTDLKRLVFPQKKLGKKWDFDISDGKSFTNGITLNTPIGGYDVDINLRGSYVFNWTTVGRYYFLKLSSNKYKWVYEHNEDNSSRYTLGRIGTRNLICIGINPSTATPEGLDSTLKKVNRIAELNGYDGWLMLNIYPQRDTYPNNIDLVSNDDGIKANNKAIQEVLKMYKFKDIWAAWGTTIEHRPFLKDCLEELSKNFDASYRWLHYDDTTKYGHPRHPLYVSYSKEFKDFDINKYLEEL